MTSGTRSAKAAALRGEIPTNRGAQRWGPAHSDAGFVGRLLSFSGAESINRNVRTRHRPWLLEENGRRTNDRTA